MSAKTMDSDNALQRVRTFLRNLDRGSVSLENADQIRDDLYKLVSRVERMQERLPQDQSPELSPDVCRVLKQIDRKKNLIDRFPFLKAASFL